MGYLGTGASNAILTESQLSGAGDLRYGAKADSINRMNRFINGSMQISQENGQSGVTVANGTGPYICDMWTLTNNSDGTIVGSQTLFPTPAGNQFRLQCAINVADTSLTATQNCYFATNIEGVHMADAMWGSTAAKPMSFRFVFRSFVTGTYSVAFRNAGTTRSYVTSFSYPSAVTDQVVTVTVPGCTDGTWDKSNGSGVTMFITLAMGAGSSIITPSPNAWASNSYIAVSGNANGIGTTGSIYISDVAAYVGSDVPNYEPPFFIDEYRRCQRYYQLVGGTVTTTATTGYTPTYPYTVPPRIAPTFINGVFNAGSGAVISHLNSFCAYQSANHSANVGFIAYANARF